MIRDFRSYADGTRLDADVCIVGAGPSGIALAREFIGTRSRILMLESGGLEPEAATDLLNRGESVGLTFDGLTAGRARAFGGTTKLWDGQCVRLDDVDFEARSWVPHSGWPITKADLDPFYERAEAFFGVSGRVNDERVWRKFGIRPPDLDGGKLGCKFTVRSSRLDLGETYRDELEKAPDVHVLLHANVTRIEANRYASAVNHLDIRTLEGKTGRVKARAFVLCCGGVENARLLLLSAGLGNRHDLVGKFFQEHPKVYTAVLQTDAPDGLQEPYGVLRKGGLCYRPKIPLGVDVQRLERVSNCVAELAYEEYCDDSGVGAAREVYRSFKNKRWPKRLGKKTRLVVGDLDRVVTAVYRRYARGRITASPGPARLQIFLEQAPNPQSRVYLSRERDAFGLNQARVDWRLTDLDRRTAQTMTRTVDAEFGRLRLARLRVADWLVADDHWAGNFHEAYHHIGTTRMADDPRKGVVNSNCQVHAVAGLYISGSSIFPTSGYANPTLTIVALALRLADHLKANMPDRR